MQAIKAAWGLVAVRPKNNTARIFLLVRAINVVNIQPGHHDVLRRAEVVQKNVRAASHGPFRAVIRDFEVPHLDVLHIV